MTYGEWTPPESYWVINAGIQFHVDERTAQRVCDEYERGDRMLVFTDLTDGEVRIPASHFYGVYASSPELRSRDNAIHKMIEAEREDFS